MMRRRRERNLTSDEISLWTHVARTVRPFSGRAAETCQPVIESMAILLADEAQDDGSQDDAARSLPGAPAASPSVRSSAKGALSASGRVAGQARNTSLTVPVQPLAPLVSIERRTLTALRRGQQPLEAVIDLHGLRQSDAHQRLRSFLVSEQHRGARLVLVITGKGGAGTSAGGEERGVLKRTVPHWLRMADLRATVLGFEDASLNHGGSGALYVRLRRLKEAVRR